MRRGTFIGISLCLLAPGAWAALPDHLSTVANPPAEACRPAAVFTAPPELLGKEGRLIPSLRQAALRADARASLVASGRFFALGHQPFGQAYADLAVTGLRSQASFRALHASGGATEAALLPALRADPALGGFSEAELVAAAGKALDRAYAALHALAHGGLFPGRPDLGWIAVSGEDDEPARPVNVPSAALPQHDLELEVGGHRIRTRYAVAEGLLDPRPAPAEPGRTLPLPAAPTLSPDARVLLYVHGMDSRLEEGLDLARALRELARATGQNWTLVTMDLPGSGYATKLDPQAIAPVSQVGRPRPLGLGFDARGRQRVPVLDFVESFVVAFVDALGLHDRLEAVVGGSLGGSIAFRLGRRHDLPWLRNVVAWSPASIWKSFADRGSLVREIALSTGWKRAGGTAASRAEDPAERARFFKQAFDEGVGIGPATIVPPTPEMWWRDSWPCKRAAIRAARIERQEIYHRNFRLWHWRLGIEQLVYSQRRSPDLPAPRYLSNHVSMLLLAGALDDYTYSRIHKETRLVASRMRNTPGRAVFLGDTGHSIHNERPALLAGLITGFLDEAADAIPDAALAAGF